MAEALQSVRTYGDELARLDIPDEIRFQRVQGTCLAGDDVAVPGPPYGKGTESVLVPAGIKDAVRQHYGAESPVKLVRRRNDAGGPVSLLRPHSDQVGEQFAVGSRIEKVAQRLEPGFDVGRVDDVAVVC